MLKLLEEPPPSSIIILITDNYHIFLPTILSRVKVIELTAEINIDQEKTKDLLLMNGEGDSLYLAQQLSKDKRFNIHTI